MRKSMLLSVVLSLCVADFTAFAAPRGRTQTQPATPTESATGVVSARAANRQRVANTGAKTNANVAQTASTTGNVSARAGKKQTKVNTPAAGAKQVVSARAGSTQKVINTGTKVATASDNVVVPQECQDALYGCMDAFCMLDNASGGRCQCSDRITELDEVLEDILKLDEQSYLMATEGVERIQMGEGADEIMKRAESAANKTVAANKTEETKTKKRELDLSAWNSSIFDDFDDAFSDDSESSINTFADKKGDALYKASAKMCAKQIPEQCSTYSNMLQLVYAQKIKSDCIAYENSLKAQKNQSQQKLQTAQKALRDAAMEEYQNQNKYSTTGECVIAFTKCMQTTAECGEDYTGCVTLAARENVKGNISGTKAKQTTIKGAISGADIKLAASTVDQLLAKKEICESVTKQCVNSNKNDAVWKAFLRNAAPALKSAELIAEQNLRSNCIPSAVECFKNACKDQFSEDEDSYDICLANPETYKSLCKVQLEPCLEATGGTYDKPEKSTLWEGLRAALNSIKVDACTKQVKSCLTGICGDDYSGCVGLDTETIGSMCSYQKLTACMDRYKAEGGDDLLVENKVREYVAQIAKGLALQIDSSLATVCQNAATTAMTNMCGGTEDCEGLNVDKNLGVSTLQYKVCQLISGEDNSITLNEAACKDNVAQITKEEMGLATLTKQEVPKIFDVYPKVLIPGFTRLLLSKHINSPKYVLKAGEVSMYSPLVSGTIDWTADIGVTTNDEGKAVFACVEGKECDDATNSMIVALNNAVDRTMSTIEADPKIAYCTTGRELQGFDKSTMIATVNKKTGPETKSEKTDQAARFPNLLDTVRRAVMDEIYAAAMNNYNSKLDELNAKRDKDYLEISAKYEAVQAENEEKIKKQRCIALNRNLSEWNYKQVVTATYDESTKTCVKKVTTTDCLKTKSPNNPSKRTCKKWGDPVETTETINM